MLPFAPVVRLMVAVPLTAPPILILPAPEVVKLKTAAPVFALTGPLILSDVPALFKSTVIFPPDTLPRDTAVVEVSVMVISPVPVDAVMDVALVSKGVPGLTPTFPPLVVSERALVVKTSAAPTRVMLPVVAVSEMLLARVPAAPMPWMIPSLEIDVPWMETLVPCTVWLLLIVTAPPATKLKLELTELLTPTASVSLT